MAKKAVITVLLGKESAERANEDIEKEILREIYDNISMIPWCEKIVKVVVKEV